MLITKTMLPFALCLLVGGIACQAQTLSPVRELKESGGPITQVAFAPVGDTVSVTLDDPRMGWLSQFLRASSGEVLSELPGFSETTHAVVFAPDGDGFAWAVGPRLISSTQSRKPGEKGGAVVKVPTSAAAFSPDGILLAASSSGVKTGAVLVRLFDAKTGALRSELKTSVKFDPLQPLENVPRQLSFSPDGKSLFAVGQQNIFHWDITSKKALPVRTVSGVGATLSPSTRFAASIAPRFLTTMPDGANISPMQLYLYDGKTKSALTVEAGNGEDLEWSGPPAFSLDSRFLAAPVLRNGKNYIVIWRTSDRKEILRRPVQFEQQSIVFGPEDGQGIALASIYENSLNKSHHAILWRLKLSP